jgi:predicted dehydrogenase
MRKIVQSGALGEIYMIGADYWHTRVGRPDYYKTAEEAGSAYMVGGVHAVDAVRFITGLDVVAVCSASTQIGSAAAEGYQMHAADALLVKYSNGAVGRVSAAIHGHMPYQLNLDILGDDGIIQNNRLFTRDNAKGDPFTILDEEGPDSGNVDDHAFPYLMAHFLECIAASSETSISLENSVNTHEIGFAADISKRLGEWVTLPLPEFS